MGDPKLQATLSKSVTCWWMCGLRRVKLIRPPTNWRLETFSKVKVISSELQQWTSVGVAQAQRQPNQLLPRHRLVSAWQFLLHFLLLALFWRRVSNSSTPIYCNWKLIKCYFKVNLSKTLLQSQCSWVSWCPVLDFEWCFRDLEIMITSKTVVFQFGPLN